MANAQEAFNDIRILVKEFLVGEDFLNAAQKKLDKFNIKFQRKIEKLMEDREDAQKLVTKYTKKRAKTKSEKRRLKYEGLVVENQNSVDAFNLEEARHLQTAEEKRQEVEHLKNRTTTLLAHIKELINKFECKKWVTVVDIADPVAIRMMRRKSKVVRFTLGKSVAEGSAVSIIKTAEKLVIVGLKCRVYFELGAGKKFRILSDDEVANLGKLGETSADGADGEV